MNRLGTRVLDNRDQLNVEVSKALQVKLECKRCLDVTNKPILPKSTAAPERKEMATMSCNDWLLFSMHLSRTDNRKRHTTDTVLLKKFLVLLHKACKNISKRFLILEISSQDDVHYKDWVSTVSTLFTLEPFNQRCKPCLEVIHACNIAKRSRAVYKWCNNVTKVSSVALRSSLDLRSIFCHRRRSACLSGQWLHWFRVHVLVDIHTNTAGLSLTCVGLIQLNKTHRVLVRQN
mmetsp:Transcript_958/g.1122  ORF Transcript_958/g.1122 Transcript_958/m.1122 type:complete len:233 (+) Transcript_958:3502-4200(+)